ncbi:recJ: single-stranded-DNA-specific exonuclease RecJ [Lysobacter silvestris]|uniref:Single-stranded-DNA-specific exonuclease RecJ n=1 Tax=Solilutibacter silvestris TaxID=1645665 RepID=A0A2K1PZ68_9GAMM|nr:recJ: single-stranded-DNA-specific exonuclease RecJ [Lysobacter silvestris]
MADVPSPRADIQLSEHPVIRRREVVQPQGDWPADAPEALRNLHAARGSRSANHAWPRLADLPSPESLLDIDRAVALLHDALDGDRHIVISSDFDCDGATACAVMLRGLRLLGARKVSFAVPDRMRHGYGLTPGFVDELEPLRPELLVTVDHGIACHAGIAAARERGWNVLVTDHHLPGETLPDANAIVDPNRHGDLFPCKMLSGVGVAFYVLSALRAAMRALGDARANDADLSPLLDLVAVGTVADLVPLDACNRALVAAGLRRLRLGKGCVGLRALIEVAGRDASRLSTADLGFAIGPRINAAGRLDDMRLGIRCLVTDDPAEARELARILHEINATRREVQDGMVAEALARVPRTVADVPALCLFDPDWHPGVIGLVASKLVEQHHRPALTFARSEPDSTSLRGSARSIPGVHMRDAIARIDALHPGLIDRFGGHAMAAGLTLDETKLPQFRAAFTDVIAAQLDADVLERVLWSDGSLAIADIDHRLAIALRDGGAWGQGYPEPAFDDVFDVLGTRCVAGKHLALELGRDGRRWRAIQFSGWTADPIPARVRVLYRPAPDDWKGGEAVQLMVLHREPAEDPIGA